MRDWIPSFLDEVTKVAAASLTKKEKRRQAIQFGALGMLGGPAVASLFHLISKGHPLPEGVKSVPRWLAASAVAGALTSGAIPAVQQRMSQSIQQTANERARRARQRAERRGAK